MNDSVQSPHETEIPVPTQEEIDHWYVLQNQLKQMKDEEISLRKKICAYYFQTPREGTNNSPMTDGWVMKMIHTINRKIDEAAFNATKDKLRALNVVPEDLVRFKPELSINAWRQLSDEAKLVVAEFMTEDAGTPQLSIQQEKRKSRK